MQGEAPEEDDEDDEEEEIDLESMTQMNMDSGGVRDFSPRDLRFGGQETVPSRDEPSWAGRLYTP